MLLIRSHYVAEQVSRQSKMWPYSTPKSDTMAYLWPLVGKKSIVLTNGPGAVTMDVELGAQLPEEQQGDFIKSYKEFLLSYREKGGMLKWCENLFSDRRRKALAEKVDGFLTNVIRSKFDDMKKTKAVSSRSILALSLSDTDVLTEEIIDGTKDQLKTFMFAGHDTTSILLQWALYELSRTPRAMKTLRAELQGLFGSDLSPEAIRKALLLKGDEVTQKMTYTSAVIKETLRLYPPAGSARLCPPGSNFHIQLRDGSSLCADGMVLYNCATLIQRDVEVYGSTKDDFVPERWLGNTDTSMATNDDEKAGIGKAGESEIPAAAWRPFERGPRNCIGQELANIEARVILACVVGGYDFEKVGLGEATLGVDGKPIINEKGQHQSNTQLYNTRQVTARPVDCMKSSGIISFIISSVFASDISIPASQLATFAMRSAVIIAAVAGMAAANPIVARDTSAQDGIDFDVFDAAPEPTKVGPAVGVASEKATYNVASASAAAAADATQNPVSPDSTLAARDAAAPNNSGCKATEPAGSGPTTTPDTYEAFMANPVYDNIANSAPAPDGYSLAFSDLTASLQNPSYISLITLKSFDPYLCQQQCDAASFCYAFNLYIERDPFYTTNDTNCQDPKSTVNYKCTLYGAKVDNTTATNDGQWRSKFHVGIKGSNGYNKLAPPPQQDGFSGPIELGGAINAPGNYMGAKYYPGPFNPGQCASACQATTTYDKKHPRSDGTYDACNFFNAYVLSKNGAPQGTYCSMYTVVWDKKYSTNYGQYRGSDRYTVSQSYGYSLTIQDSGKL
ncbi:putative sterigmatocystin biosynthesis P450 monooxygenase stcS [Colletotrichum sp. SAR 10_70]|nr:putative sterigmatocystin biosynthesis P450 monooxygenase stcS [Colletotrichum sp. SAR 10_71]KAI8169842.1 putative sterigmatocystin biosynthesis P450 monooxygenase stcS [Colletotrichum sp. SAR 10_70]KAI8205295.1 putative sterigmatocystin biosynthesis P450 monooxygenase stcS [Colletotrichum sp. SAR 10_76]KAI8221403.1 putative sterigmatocystin biosynthesis P450 monooxygenase stcS [Colletotrichum sp. SAR 10_77]KAJ4999097.1 putative sterigmatocystin biosynthesis P450 monooxygenase stcS [Colletot